MGARIRAEATHGDLAGLVGLPLRTSAPVGLSNGASARKRYVSGGGGGVAPCLDVKAEVVRQRRVVGAVAASSVYGRYSSSE
jgi:hypothetical protein